MNNQDNHSSDVFVGRIGDKQIAIQYEQGHREYAEQKFDKDLGAYNDALAIIDTGSTVLIDELQNTYELAEIERVSRCEKCGHKALKERRNRMRVFGGLFWTGSEVSPYRTCSHCGHDQEIKGFRNMPMDYFVRLADMRVERAKKLVAKYQGNDLRLDDPESKVKA